MAKLTGRGMSQGDMVKALVVLVDTMMSSPTLAVDSGGAATFKTTVVPSGGIVFRINGVHYLKANLSAQVLTGFNLASMGVGQFTLLRVELDSAGAVGIVQGGIFNSAAEASARPPSRSADKVTIGTILLPASFVPGTTALDAAGVVFTDGDPDLSALALAL